MVRNGLNVRSFSRLLIIASISILCYIELTDRSLQEAFELGIVLLIRGKRKGLEEMLQKQNLTVWSGGKGLYVVPALIRKAQDGHRYYKMPTGLGGMNFSLLGCAFEAAKGNCLEERVGQVICGPYGEPYSIHSRMEDPDISGKHAKFLVWRKGVTVVVRSKQGQTCSITVYSPVIEGNKLVLKRKVKYVGEHAGLPSDLSCFQRALDAARKKATTLSSEICYAL